MSELTALPKGSLILITGTNGYIGSHIANTLLELGLRVRGTVRSDKPWLSEYFNNKFGEGAYEQVVLPHFEDEEALGKVLDGVSGVAHVASDVSFRDDADAVINWVVKATQGVLAAAAKQPSVKRVVLTSSSSAVVFPVPNQTGVRVDETSWNDAAVKAARDPNTPAENKPWVVYGSSKTEGERAAWEWVEKNKPGFVFNSILPNLN
ncbi:Aldehyde reductase 2-like protein 7, partial [Colletotrichum chlorophyti]